MRYVSILLLCLAIAASSCSGTRPDPTTFPTSSLVTGEQFLFGQGQPSSPARTQATIPDGTVTRAETPPPPALAETEQATNAPTWTRTPLPTATHTSTPVPLNVMVAQSIVNALQDMARSGYQSPERSIVAQVVTITLGVGPQLPPLNVWRVRDDRLVGETAPALSLALGQDRTQWPPFTLLFALENRTATEMFVMVYTLYDRGLLPSSRGGNGQRWRFQNRGGNWEVVDKIPFAFWD